MNHEIRIPALNNQYFMKCRNVIYFVPKMDAWMSGCPCQSAIPAPEQSKRGAAAGTENFFGRLNF